MSVVETAQSAGELLTSQRQTDLVRELHRLSATKVAAAAHVAADLKDGLAHAEEEVQAARRDLPSSREEQLQSEKVAYQAQRKVIFERFDREYGTLQVEHDRLVTEANAAAEHVLRTEKQQLEESKWEADAIYEAIKNEPAKKFEEFKKQAEVWAERLGQERVNVRALLERWKLTDLGEIPVPPVAEFDDKIAPSDRLQQLLTTITEGREKLQVLSLPDWAVGPLPFFATAALTLGLVFPAWFLTKSLVALVVCAIVGVVLGTLARRWLQNSAWSHVEKLYMPTAQALSDGDAFLPRCVADQRALAERKAAENLAKRDTTIKLVETTAANNITTAQRRRDALRDELEQTYPPRMQALVVERDRATHQLEESHRARMESIQREYAGALTDAENHYRRVLEDLHRTNGEQRKALEDTWNAGLDHLRAQVAKIHAEADRYFPKWSELADESWKSLNVVPAAMKLGESFVGLRHPVKKSSEAEVEAGIPPMPGEPNFVLPATAPCPNALSLLLEAKGEGRRAAVRTLQAYMLRLVTSLPPSKARFTIIDPVGLGENFAAFMHLGDYDEQLITNRIWTEPRHIEQRLADLSEHMENVIQKYLRNEFKTIDEYNHYADEVAEPFRFLVIANFPANFSEAAARRLLSIAASGPRCGVFTLISVDGDQPLPSGFSLKDLRQHATCLAWTRDRFVGREKGTSSAISVPPLVDNVGGKPIRPVPPLNLLADFPLTLETSPPDDVVTRILHNIGAQAKAAGRVEVPFEAICPPVDEYWKSSSRSGIEVPLGRAGATRLQGIKLGQGTSQHVLVAGKTGSGKSTLLHALITCAALRYSPDELELYLVDFKQGVEFKTYAVHALPHARVVAIESDREFGLSVLERLDTELRGRAELFRKAEVQDLAGFRDAQPDTPMPRLLLIVDEFQEFFTEDDRTSHEAALLLDRLVRQGRAFGIHILLGSQTLAGAYSLARSTLGQMAVRIALQCSEADAHLILSEDNTAARLLSRAGEAIYNDSNGLIEGNHPFQVVWLPDERREHFLEQVIELQEQNGNSVPRPRLVFEGNVPADLEKNHLLSEWIAGRRERAANEVESFAWLGEAVSIKDPTAAVFRPQSGSNLLLIGQNDEAALGMFVSSMVSLTAQYPTKEASADRGLAPLLLLDGAPVNSIASTTLVKLSEVLPLPLKRATGRDVTTIVAEVAAEVARRQQSQERNPLPIYLFVFAAHTLRDLRKDDDDFGYSREDKPPSPAKQFVSILRDGPALGVHVIAWCDTLNNLNRTWDRQALKEFEQRVVLQMSSTDSSTLIDTPAAAKLGMNRALFADEAQSVLEKFRPYRIPPIEWLKDVLLPAADSA